MKRYIFTLLAGLVILMFHGIALGSQWSLPLGGSNDDRANSIQQTADGGFIVAGSTSSSGAGGSDAWILKLNADGAVAWQKTYGGSNDDRADSIQQTADGGFIVAGSTSSFGAGGSDAWVLKLNADGAVAWQKTYGGSNDDRADSIRQAADGGLHRSGLDQFLRRRRLRYLDTETQRRWDGGLAEDLRRLKR